MSAVGEFGSCARVRKHGRMWHKTLDVLLVPQVARWERPTRDRPGWVTLGIFASRRGISADLTAIPALASSPGFLAASCPSVTLSCGRGRRGSEMGASGLGMRWDGRPRLGGQGFSEWNPRICHPSRGHPTAAPTWRPLISTTMGSRRACQGPLSSGSPPIQDARENLVGEASMQPSFSWSDLLHRSFIGGLPRVNRIIIPLLSDLVPLVWGMLPRILIQKP